MKPHIRIVAPAFSSRRSRQIVAFSLIGAQLAIAAPTAAWGAGAGGAGGAGEFDYPELLVTPRASERLALEARREGDSRWLSHLPIQASAIATLTAGIFQLTGTPSATALVNGGAIAGISVGGAWLVTTIALSALYSPYSSGQSDVESLPKATQRDQLTRERYAESRIDAAASLGTRLEWISLVTHLGASGYMVSQGLSDPLKLVTAGIATVASITPLIFRYHWRKVAREQHEYKKRIYAPIATFNGGFSVIPDPATGAARPGVALSLRF